MKKLVCIIAVCFGLNGMAQSDNDNNARLDNIGINDFGNGMWVNSSGQKTDIKGSPYLYDSWVNGGKVFLSNKFTVVVKNRYYVRKNKFCLQQNPVWIPRFSGYSAEII